MSAFLVFIACSYHSGCSETSSAFYLSEPAIQQSAKNIENFVESNVSKNNLMLVGTAVNAVANKEITFAVTQHLSIKSKLNDNTSLSYTWAL